MAISTYSRKQNETAVYYFLRKTAKLTVAASCGILANINEESSFNTDALGDGGSSYGLCQWNKERRTNLKKYCKSNGLNSASINGQMSFLMHELKSYNSIMYYIQGADGRGGAYNVGYRFCYDFERPANKGTKSTQRGALAQKFYDFYKGKDTKILKEAKDSDVVKKAGQKSSSSSIGDSDSASTSPTDISITTTGLVGDLPLSKTVDYQESMDNALDALSKAGDSYCSIIDLVHGGEFKFYSSTDIPESISVSWSSPGNVTGRSVPVITYDSTGPRAVTVSLELFAGAHYRPGIDVNSSDIVGILHKDVDFLKSLEYPDYSSSIVNPPPLVLASLGSGIKIRGVVQGMQIIHHKPYDSKNRAMYISVSFSIVQVSDDPPGYLDIRNRTMKSY